MSEIISAARAANRDGTPRWRRVVSPLFVELHWLDGLTWRMLAMTLAIVAPTVIGNVIMGMQYGDVGMPPVLPAFVFEAFALPIVVAALLNLRRRALPLPVILIVAVLLVSLIGRGVIANVVYEGLPAAWSGPPLKKFFVNILVYTRQAAFLWGMAAAAWYFVRRASIREVALREAEVGRLRLDAGMLEARLRMMQAQVEPHFLFNTLAHVRRLY